MPGTLKMFWNPQKYLHCRRFVFPQAQGLNSFPTRRNILCKVDVKSTWMIWSLLILMLIDIFITGVFSLDLVELYCFTNHCGSYKPQLVKSNFGFWLEGITGEPRETRSARGKHDCSGQTSRSIVGTKKLNNSMNPGLNWWKASVLTTTTALLRHWQVSSIDYLLIAIIYLLISNRQGSGIVLIDSSVEVLVQSSNSYQWCLKVEFAVDWHFKLWYGILLIF